MIGTDAAGTPRPLRVALAGYGMAGREIHRPLLLSTGYEITHVVTANSDRIAQVHVDLPGADVVPNLAAALVERPDVLVLATATGAHYEGAMEALNAGVPVVVDKPIAVTGDSAERLVEHANRVGVPFTVFQNRRWDDEQRTLAALVEAQAFGQVLRFERRWERWRPVPKSRWKENATASDGGGLLLDLGAHLVDSATQLFGSVETVYAELRAINTPAEDDVFIALRHATGVVSHLQAGGLVAAPGPRTRVLGTLAGYANTEFEAESSAFAIVGSEATEKAGWIVTGEHRDRAPEVPGGHEDFYQIVASWLRGRTPPPVDPADAVRTAWLLDAARLSARDQRVIKVDALGRTQ